MIRDRASILRTALRRGEKKRFIDLPLTWAAKRPNVGKTSTEKTPGPANAWMTKEFHVWGQDGAGEKGTGKIQVCRP